MFAGAAASCVHTILLPSRNLDRHATQPWRISCAREFEQCFAWCRGRPAGGAAQQAPRGCADAAALEWGAEGYLADAACIAAGMEQLSHGCVHVMHSVCAARSSCSWDEHESCACS